MSSNYHSWSEKEVDILCQHYPNSSWETLHSLLPNRSRNAIYGRAESLGLSREKHEFTRKFSPRYWSDQELALLRQHYPSSPLPTLLSALPNRDQNSIYAKAKSLGLSRTRGKYILTSPVYWSEQEIDVLRQNYPRLSPKELTQLLPRYSVGSIYNKLNALGLRTPAYSFWSDQEVALLRQHYPTAQWSELLSLLPNRSRVSIDSKARNLNLSRKKGIN